jgi:phosphatidylglycerol:prolipoprotein diacylglycerol transferase
MLWLALNKKWLTRPGCLIGFFIFAYGLFRFLVEFFRQPDSYFITNENPLGYLLSSGNLSLTMGQALSLPMIIFGLLIIMLRYKK